MRIIMPGLEDKIRQALHSADTLGLLPGGEWGDNNHIAISKSARPTYMLLCIQKINKVGKLTSETQQAIITHSNTMSAADALVELAQNDCLNKETRGALMKINDPAKIVLPFIEGYLKLKGRCILTNQTYLLGSDYCDALANHIKPDRLGEAFTMLDRSQLLTGSGARANFSAIQTHPKAVEVAMSLIQMKKFGLLSNENAQENRQSVIQHADPLNLSIALGSLGKEGYLTEGRAQTIFNDLIKHPEPLKFVDNFNVSVDIQNTQNKPTPGRVVTEKESQFDPRSRAMAISERIRSELSSTRDKEKEEARNLNNGPGKKP